MENKEIRKLLKEKTFVVGVPEVIKFKFKKGGYAKGYGKFKASKGTRVVKWSDVLKILRNTR